MEGNDMITNLYRLPKLEDRKDTIQIKRAFVGDKGTILNFIKDNFSDIKYKSITDKKVILHKSNTEFYRFRSL